MAAKWYYSVTESLTLTSCKLFVRNSIKKWKKYRKKPKPTELEKWSFSHISAHIFFPFGDF